MTGRAFLRPEAIAWLKRWRGCLAAGVMAAGTVAMLGPSALAGAPGPVGVLVVALVMAGLIFREGWSLAHRPQSADGPGIVEIAERRIAFFAPERGGVVSIEALTRVDVVSNALGPFADDLHWVLWSEGAEPVVIPSTAEGADGLFDAFAALPGFDYAAVTEAMGCAEDRRFVVWRRDDRPAGLPLAPPGGRA